jgi:hypothetical protein
MTYIIIAMSMLTGALHPIVSFGFETQEECHEFVEVMIVAPERNTMYGCYLDERILK